ncbi:dUTP diphosphatase [Salimicrobium halophilum]|uniref:Dimeric dUTPase, all-alpha-NTP-PPase (MazG) superfamily n=1 Tax=Salimicrobium halophilum TaxID=86666 RepID=A0A1G8VGF2_9BACI|nr:dUTP diphosphatase [Salimicrobium halophilum]SDJ65103.1 Dimeric dUTPase, all-alpha-NTP-PPase (MazG) superfamily [Salimicrobium halophilum]
MEWQKLYDYQRQLDAYIEEKNNVDRGNIIDQKTLAFYVELGELANETRCFKFWSGKPSSDHETIKEEYVDGLHFLLSLGIETDTYVQSVQTNPSGSMTEAFLTVYQLLEKWKHEKGETAYQKLFDAYISLAETLGITEQEMKEAYLGKHEENYNRQERGY